MDKRLLIIRHAKAEEHGSRRDIDRDLLPQGITQSAKVGKLLFQEGVMIDCGISSPANRTYQTAKVIFEQIKRSPEELITEGNLYGLGTGGYLACLNGLSEDLRTVAIFGHNPDISFFAEYLTRDDIKGSMHKATLVEIGFENLIWSEIGSKSGTLIRRVDVADITFI